MMRIGLFTDAHFAEGLTANKTRMCWKSLDKVKRLLAAFAGMDFAVQLGDLINACGDPDKDMENIRKMQHVLAEGGIECFGVLGNHDVESARKAVFLPGHARGYYHFDRENVRFIVLDGNFTSEMISYEDAEWDWTDSYIPNEQLAWLADTLAQTEGKAVILCHQNLDARANDPHVVKNSEEARRILEESGKVIAVIQGHCHSGCFQVINSIPYYTLKALCEGEAIPYAEAVIDGNGIRVVEKELTKE
ncbi:MAG: metallophosphoesterase [Clostridia bacterium]|nr:metallophosphoesterase [Clostridia bacterium]